jgi:hypothetical protein
MKAKTENLAAAATDVNDWVKIVVLDNGVLSEIPGVENRMRKLIAESKEAIAALNGGEVRDG